MAAIPDSLMRSLHVITTDVRRGAETFAVDLAATLHVDGNVAEVVALSPSHSARPHQVRCLGPSRRSAVTLRSLRRAAAEADVVVAHGSSTLEACAVGLAGTGVPFVSRIIGEPSYWLSPGWRHVLGARLQRRATRHVALWTGAAAQVASLYGVPTDQIDIVGNAVPEARFPLWSFEERREARRRLNVEPERPCFAYVGALSAEKAVETVVLAVADIGDALLLVAGDGPCRTSLEAQAARVAPGRVRFLGPVDDPSEIYAASDLLLLPSRSEGMPAVVIEAGLIGTASVATAVGAVPEMIEHGITGALAPRRDPQGFVSCVREALPEAAAMGAKAAQDFRGRYTMERLAPYWAESLQRACE